MYKNIQKISIGTASIDTCSGVSYHGYTFPGEILLLVISPYKVSGRIGRKFSYIFIEAWCFQSVDLYSRELMRKECR